MAKKMDPKQFLMEKGERIGIALAALIMIWLMFSGGSSVLSSDRPDQIQEWIRHKAEAINLHVSSNPAIPLPPLEPIFSKTEIAADEIKVDEYVTRTPNFIDNPLEFNKRTNPVVLTPKEYHAVVVQGAAESLMIAGQKDQMRIGLLKPVDRPKGGTNLTPQQKEYLEQVKKYTEWIAQMQGRPAASPVVPGGVPGVNPAGDTAGTTTDYRLEWHDLTKFPADMEPALTVIPVRMVIVTGSFPYREQLEVFKFALRLPLLDLLKNDGELLPHFQRINVRRRTLDAAGRPKDEWRELDLEGDIRRLLGPSFLLGSQEDPSELRRVIFPGLVMNRPRLARGTYPDPDLGQVAKSLRVLREKTKKDPEAQVLSPFAKKLSEGMDIFSGSAKPNEEKKTKVPSGGGGGSKEAELIVPDHCLVRFIDVTVQPGQSYEYQIQIKVDNPNLGKTKEVAWPGLAEIKDLYSQWGPSIKVDVPSETYIYGTELDAASLRLKEKLDYKLINDRDVAWMQVHRWLETTNLNPEQRGSTVPVGDWSVGDVPVRRGEYIGRLEPVKVPVWFPTKKWFDIAVPVQATTKPVGIGSRPIPIKGIPVNFATEHLLVDWEGGKIYQNFRPLEKGPSKDVREEANVEYLILSPDGKLRVRNSRIDAGNRDREARYKAWSDWVQAVEQAGGRPPGDPGGKGTNRPDPFKR